MVSGGERAVERRNAHGRRRIGRRQRRARVREGNSRISPRRPANRFRPRCRRCAMRSRWPSRYPRAASRPPRECPTVSAALRQLARPATAASAHAANGILSCRRPSIGVGCWRRVNRDSGDRPCHGHAHIARRVVGSCARSGAHRPGLSGSAATAHIGRRVVRSVASGAHRPGGLSAPRPGAHRPAGLSAPRRATRIGVVSVDGNVTRDAGRRGSGAGEADAAASSAAKATPATRQLTAVGRWSFS